MDTGVCVSEEHGSVGSDSDRRLLPITFKEFNRDTDMVLAVPIVWESWYVVNEEDLADTMTLPFMGQDIPMTKSEAQIYWYLNQGCELLLALQGGQVIGVMAYQYLFESILIIRMLYLQPEVREGKLGKEFVQAVGKPIKKVIFQTRKAKPPILLLKTVGNRKTMINEDEKLITWEMPWTVSREGV